MKTLTLTEPWATLMANGFKRVETRSWGTSHRGPILIHAGKGLPRECRALFGREPFASFLTRCQKPVPHVDGGSLARLLCRVELVDCVNTQWLLEGDTALAKQYRDELGIGSVAAGGTRQFELEFGDYTAGRWAWITRGLKRCENPFIVRGFQGLWGLDDGVLRAVAPELLA